MAAQEIMSAQEINIQDAISDSFDELVAFLGKEKNDPISKIACVNCFKNFVADASDALIAEIKFKEVAKPRLNFSFEKLGKIVNPNNYEKEEKPELQCKKVMRMQMELLKQKEEEDKKLKRKTIQLDPKTGDWKRVEEDSQCLLRREAEDAKAEANDYA